MEKYRDSNDEDNINISIKSIVANGKRTAMSATIGIAF
jgi:hypothetical protein